MKKIITMLFLSLLVSSVFAVDLVKYATYETESMGTIDVYFDYEATEPFDIKNESIGYFLFLQDNYKDVYVCLENMEDWWPGLCSKAVEHNCYVIIMKCEDGCADTHINSDGTVTVYTYTYRVPKNQAEE